ncbi:hypothetical protein [Tardiphaga sp. OK246]|uniref:hypothetical protein n=1 Tax=Tardiphaga sp. OK246 TaxID=1855307 RepID=UPI000B779446|nr:hypothetical protein [Tardiphaga sp. OK246]
MRRIVVSESGKALYSVELLGLQQFVIFPEFGGIGRADRAAGSGGSATVGAVAVVYCKGSSAS